jgi:hypothetical protein
VAYRAGRRSGGRDGDRVTGVTSLASWLATRTPAPPPALSHRMREALSGRLSRSAAEAPVECLAAGEAVLADLLARGRTSREAAIDLLAADALVTYAFEAMAENVATAEVRASLAGGDAVGSGRSTAPASTAMMPAAAAIAQDALDDLAAASMRRIAGLPHEKPAPTTHGS